MEVYRSSGISNWVKDMPALPCLTVGFTAFAVQLDIVDWYEVEDFYYNIEDRLYYVGDYYPLIFVVIGLLIIITSLRRARSKNDSRFHISE